MKMVNILCSYLGIEDGDYVMICEDIWGRWWIYRAVIWELGGNIWRYICDDFYVMIVNIYEEDGEYMCSYLGIGGKWAKITTGTANLMIIIWSPWWWWWHKLVNYFTQRSQIWFWHQCKTLIILTMTLWTEAMLLQRFHSSASLSLNWLVLKQSLYWLVLKTIFVLVGF